ncbi:unnamed protein product [Musa acuminata var. zebrina]
MPLTTRTLPSLRSSPSTPIPLRNPLSSSHPASHWTMGRKYSKPRSISCTVRFRPCIDIHKGKVKQIVGSTLRDSTDGGASDLVTNFESDKSPAEFANLYKKDGLKGGHVIVLGADAASQSAAFEALRAYPGGINADNAMNYLEEGASHVIVTSYIFSDGKMDPEQLKHLVNMIGKNRLVLDLSCRKKVSYFFASNCSMDLYAIDDVYSNVLILETYLRKRGNLRRKLTLDSPIS